MDYLFIEVPFTCFYVCFLDSSVVPMPVERPTDNSALEGNETASASYFRVDLVLLCMFRLRGER